MKDINERHSNIYRTRIYSPRVFFDAKQATLGMFVAACVIGSLLLLL